MKIRLQGKFGKLVCDSEAEKVICLTSDREDIEILFEEERRAKHCRAYFVFNKHTAEIVDGTVKILKSMLPIGVMSSTVRVYSGGTIIQEYAVDPIEVQSISDQIILIPYYEALINDLKAKYNEDLKILTDKINAIASAYNDLKIDYDGIFGKPILIKKEI